MMQSSKLKVRILGAGASLVLVSVLAFSPLTPVPAPKAHAQWAVAVVSDVPSTLGRIADGLAWTAAKTVIQSLTQSVVNWINSGFEGSPAFVTDLNRNLGNLADGVANDFINGLNQVVMNNTGINIRAPFQDQIAAQLREEFYRTTSSYGFDVRHPYTDCYSNGFSISGFLCQSQNPANNPYGRYQIARNELFKQLDTEAQNRITELGWGKGFLSWRGPCGPYGNTPATTSDSHEAGHTVQLSQADNSSKCPIRTPGAIIENTLGITTTSPFRQLELADSVNEIVAALMTQMVNQVLGGGGLTGLSQPSSGGGPSYVQQAANASGGFAASITQARTLITAAQGGWQRVVTAATSARQACTSNATKAAQADSVLTNANTRLAEATAALTKLATMEADRARLANSTDPNAINTLVASLSTLLADSKSFASGEAEGQDTGNQEPGSQYSQMTRLAASCR